MADFDAAGLLAFGDQKEQPGSDVKAARYLRNAKIFAKLTQIAQPRRSSVFGAGHAFWLRHFAQHTPDLVWPNQPSPSVRSLRGRVAIASGQLGKARLGLPPPSVGCLKCGCRRQMLSRFLA